jgi:hypothetical protein
MLENVYSFSARAVKARRRAPTSNGSHLLLRGRRPPLYFGLVCHSTVGVRRRHTQAETCDCSGRSGAPRTDGRHHANDIEAASRAVADAGCELLGQITRLAAMAMRYAYRHFRGPDGRVYGLNEYKPPVAK